MTAPVRGRTAAAASAPPLVIAARAVAAAPIRTHAPLIYEFAAHSTDLVFVTPTREAGPASILDEIAAATAAVGRDGEPLRVYADLVVLLDTEDATGTQRLARLNEAAGAEYASDAAVFAGSADELAELLIDWSGRGLTVSGCGPASRSTIWPPSPIGSFPSCSAAVSSAPATRTDRCARCSDYPPPFPTATRPPERGPHEHSP
ncbi:hypothetical protein ACWDO0_08320 [Nocardia rhamnosiphila]